VGAEIRLLELKTPMLRLLYQDWDAHRRGRELPARTDFDPLELKYCLGNLSLIDVAYDPLRFHFRIHASNVAQGMGFDLTGKSLDAMPDPEYRQIVHNHYAEVVHTRRPVAQYRDRQMTNQHVWSCEVLALPLSADGTLINMLMSGFVWY